MSTGNSKRAVQSRRIAPKPSVLLVDNGSLRPAATLWLRKIATALGKRLERKVEPVSLLHSNKVPARRLGGRKAEILKDAVARRLQRGARDIVVLPLFFGPSRALTELIPNLIREWRRYAPELTVRVAPPLAAVDEDRLALILESQVRTKLTPRFLRGQRAHVALVDHGSPVRAVTQVRDRLAAQLRRRLAADVAGVAACSMERLMGAAYAFNEPLLETLLAKPGWSSGPVIVAQLFLLPGRHAGPRGDVERICRHAREKSPGLRTVRTKLAGEDPAIIDILAAGFATTRAAK